MSTPPTPAHPATHPTAQSATAHPAVPLAVWPALGYLPTVAGSSPLLDRLIAEYAPAERLVLLCHPARHRLELQLTAWETGNPAPATTPDGRNVQEGARLVIGLFHGRNPRDGELMLLADVARTALRPGGFLAVLTRSRPRRLRPHQDHVSRTVQTATAAGFGYLQHVIIPDPAPPGVGTEHQQNTRYAAERNAAILHRTTHHDVTIFRWPAAPATAQPAAIAAAE
jgi:hypothetical protein